MQRILPAIAGAALLLGASFALADEVPLSDMQADQVTAGDCVVCGYNSIGYNNGSFNGNNSWGYNGNNNCKGYLPC